MAEKAELASGGVRRRRRGIVAAIQYVLFFALGITMFVALFYDSRLYYGIDGNGQSIYRERDRSGGGVRREPVSADSATGIDDSSEFSRLVGHVTSQ